MKNILLKSIRAYQRTKFFRGAFFRMFFITDAVCRFRPSCSEYTYQAIEKYGSAKGLFLAFKRIVRCHPFSKGGHDPVV
jgi:putative membrane protein insertion efficiency factor